MGKMRFKLSHVMPHAWFFKLKEVGKPGRSLTYKAMEPGKSAYASPINHKAIDIPFPAAETPKESPDPPSSEDFSSMNQLHLIEISADDECRSSIVFPHTSARCLDEHIIPCSVDADQPCALSSASHAKSDHTVSCRVNFDVRELERRLKALGSEDRRKYYTSPMLLSVAVPTPMIDDGMHLGIARPMNGGNGAEEASMDMAAMVFSLDGSGSNERGSCRSPLADPDSYAADGERPFVSCVSKGEGLCSRSFDESNRHSTSSSDTGFERGSSSMWERDVFSITSDGSEAFNAIYADDVESMHKSRQRYRRLRERASPSLYMDSGLSRFYDDHRHYQEAELHAEHDRMSDFYKNGAIVGDADNEIVGTCDRNLSVLNASDDESCGQGLYMSKTAVYCDDSSRKKMSTYSNLERQSPSIRKVRSVCRATKLPLDYEEMSDSLSMQGNGDIDLDLRSVQYDSGDDPLSECTRKSSGDFSYVRCKERLLSHRSNLDRPTNCATIGEGEQASPLNFSESKLKQRTCAQSKARAGAYLDPCLYNSCVSLGRGRSNGYDTIESTDMDSMASTSLLPSSTSDRCASLHRPRTSIYHIKSPQFQAKGFPAQLWRKPTGQDQGPSRLKGMSRAAARETTSFDQFSPSSDAGGATPLTTRGECSRVFDSFAMVKCSYEPKLDFKESMVEMIMEKDLRRSHDMVELLQCYLTLNPDTYHDTIVKVFTEVWSEMFRHV